MIDEETTATPVAVTRSVGNSRTCALGGLVSILLKGEDTGGRFVLMELTGRKGNPSPRHIHHWKDEVVYVLEGENAGPTARREGGPNESRKLQA